MDWWWLLQLALQKYWIQLNIQSLQVFGPNHFGYLYHTNFIYINLDYQITFIKKQTFDFLMSDINSINNWLSMIGYFQYVINFVKGAAWFSSLFSIASEMKYNFWKNNFDEHFPFILAHLPKVSWVDTLIEFLRMLMS